jgi:hypothetical protein
MDWKKPLIFFTKQKRYALVQIERHDSTVDCYIEVDPLKPICGQFYTSSIQVKWFMEMKGIPDFRGINFTGIESCTPAVHRRIFSIVDKERTRFFEILGRKIPLFSMQTKRFLKYGNRVIVDEKNGKIAICFPGR